MIKRMITWLLSISALFSGERQFDAQRAFQFLEKQVTFGYRIPGTDDHKACADWIIERCGAFADTVIVQSFSAYNPFAKKWVDARNIIARFRPGESDRVMLSTHWDTRPVSDMDFAKPFMPVPGANDGASGTAVLLELLDKIQALDMKAGLDIVFWDAEDMGIAGSGRYFCQGSEFYALHPLAPVPQKGILIDMIGDKDLELPIEKNSMLYAPELVMSVWNIAAELGYQHIFKKQTGPEVYDDHVPLNTLAGIPTIDIIDFSYTHMGRNLWHTTKDLPAFCSPRSLQCVGETLLLWLSRQ